MALIGRRRSITQTGAAHLRPARPPQSAPPRPFAGAAAAALPLLLAIATATGAPPAPAAMDDVSELLGALHFDNGGAPRPVRAGQRFVNVPQVRAPSCSGPLARVVRPAII